VPLPSFSAPNSPSAVSSPGRSARNGTARPVPSSATITTAVSQEASNGAGGSAFKPNVVAVSLELGMTMCYVNYFCSFVIERRFYALSQ
jgi:hypothetical protein